MHLDFVDLKTLDVMSREFVQKRHGESCLKQLALRDSRQITDSI